jgi:hypothetical protein
MIPFLLCSKFAFCFFHCPFLFSRHPLLLLPKEGMTNKQQLQVLQRRRPFQDGLHCITSVPWPRPRPPQGPVEFLLRVCVADIMSVRGAYDDIFGKSCVVASMSFTPRGISAPRFTSGQIRLRNRIRNRVRTPRTLTTPKTTKRGGCHRLMSF